MEKKQNTFLLTSRFHEVGKNLFTFLFELTKRKVKNLLGTFFPTSPNLKLKNFFHTFFSSSRFSTFEISLRTFLFQFSFVKIKKIVFTFCSTSPNHEVKKIFCTFLLQLQNLKVRKNPRKKHFRNMCLNRLKALFQALKTEKLRFLNIFNVNFIFLLKTA